MLDEKLQKSEVTEQDWILGKQDAPVTLLEYGDFECPYCGKARPILEELVKQYPDSIRLVFRNFPVTSSHPHAGMAAEVAEAAGAQNKFWAMHDMLFTHQQQLDFEDLRRYAQKIGLDMDRFDKDMQAHRYQSEVKQDFRTGIQDGVNGTPTIFINRQRFDGPRDWDSILAAISDIMPV